MRALAVWITASAAAVILPPREAPAQQWQPLFDAGGFEDRPFGLVPRYPSFYPDLMPHWVAGGGSGLPPQLPQLPEVAPGPASSGRSILLHAFRRSPWDGSSGFSYRHQYERFGLASFTFPGMPSRGGYRGLRISFDMYHVFDADRGLVSWGIGGVTARRGEAFAQLVWDVTERLDIRFDEWIHVSLTFDFENKLFHGSYAGEESSMVALPADWQTLETWSFVVAAAPYCDCPEPVADAETAWLDNLVIEVIPPCPADCDLDYAHTFFDFLCFQNMFAIGSPRADCNLDFSLDFLDFLCFQDYFAAGCD